MNNELLAIAIFRTEFQNQGIDIARVIGKVDHGKTSCKTPYAVKYIERAVTRNKSHNKK